MPDRKPLGATATESEAVIIVGAGPSGLATAAALKKRGIDVAVLEKGKALGNAWRQRYDGLRLNTLRWLSSLPGLRLERAYGRWVARDDFVHYLESYADRFGIVVETGALVERLDRDGEDWVVSTSSGPRRARHVVIATGLYHSCRQPDWAGVDVFSKHLLHAGEYRAASEYASRDVLVVGAGNTGTEIAQQLACAGASRVRLSVRTSPNIVPREIWRVPTHPLSILARAAPPAILDISTRLTVRLLYGNLGPLGLPTPAEGVQTASRRGEPPVIDSGFVAAVKRREIEVVAAVVSLSREEVHLSDGSRIQPDVVIAALGYEAGLKSFVGHLGVLDRDGKPMTGAPAMPADSRGLYFIGYKPKLGGVLFDLGWEARRIAKAIAASSSPP